MDELFLALAFFCQWYLYRVEDSTFKWLDYYVLVWTTFNRYCALVKFLKSRWLRWMVCLLGFDISDNFSDSTIATYFLALGGVYLFDFANVFIKAALVLLASLMTRLLMLLSSIRQSFLIQCHQYEISSHRFLASTPFYFPRYDAFILMCIRKITLSSL